MEENKVATREKLAALIADGRCGGFRHGVTESDYAAADAILQSADLRVTLVEPKYQWIGRCVYRFLEITTTEIAQFVDAEHAREYADFKNSKEPK